MKSIKHKLGERNTVVMRALIQEVGVIGFGVYWYLIEELNEKEVLKINDIFFNIYSVVFKINESELKLIISEMLKYKILVMDGERLSTIDLIGIKEVRSKAGRKAMENRWKKPKELKKEVIVKAEESKNKGDKLEEMIKQAIAKNPIKDQLKEVEKKTVKRKVTQTVLETSVSSEDFEKLENMGVKNPLKEYEFLPMFNEIKLKYKPNSKGNQALSATDKKNLKRLVSTGYTKEDFTKAIHGQMCSKWVIENDMQVPTHILRNENFVRYLEKSTYNKEEVFKANLIDEPIYK